MFTPQYSWNISKVGIKHQSIRNKTDSTTTTLTEWQYNFPEYIIKSKEVPVYHMPYIRLGNKIILYDSLDLIVLAHWNNSLCNTSLHSDTSSWFRGNQSLLFPFFCTDNCFKLPYDHDHDCPPLFNSKIDNYQMEMLLPFLFSYNIPTPWFCFGTFTLRRLFIQAVKCQHHIIRWLEWTCNKLNRKKIEQIYA